MTSPPPVAPHGLRSEPARPVAITRILPTDDLPDGVDVLASADGKTIFVRRSLDKLSRRRAIREVMTSIRRHPRLALYPAISVEAIRQLSRRVGSSVSSALANSAATRRSVRMRATSRPDRTS
jgi:hypothetical protein